MPAPLSPGTSQTPTAVFGDLRRSSLGGVLISALNEGTSGTLVIDPDEKHARPAMVLIQGGALVAVEGSNAAGFETQVLALFARRGTFQLLPNRKLVRVAASTATGLLDPVSAIAMAFSGGRCDGELHLPSQTAFVRDPAFDLRRLRFEPELTAWLRERSQVSAVALTELLGLDPLVSDRIVHALVVTGACHRQGEEPVATAPCKPISGFFYAAEEIEPQPEADALPPPPRVPRSSDPGQARRDHRSLYKSARRHLAEENWSAAMAELRSAIEQDDAQADYHVALAWAMLQQHRMGSTALRRMLASVDRGLCLDREHAHAHYVRGLILARMGDEPGARRAFLRTLKRDPKHAGARRELRGRHTPAEPTAGFWRRLFG